MKNLLILVICMFGLPALAIPPENESEVLYNHKNSSVTLDYSTGHVYTKGPNDSYYRDDGVRIQKSPSGLIETSSGNMYMPINNSGSRYYLP